MKQRSYSFNQFKAKTDGKLEQKCKKCGSTKIRDGNFRRTPTRYSYNCMECEAILCHVCEVVMYPKQHIKGRCVMCNELRESGEINYNGKDFVFKNKNTVGNIQGNKREELEKLFPEFAKRYPIGKEVHWAMYH